MCISYDTHVALSPPQVPWLRGVACAGAGAADAAEAAAARVHVEEVVAHVVVPHRADPPAGITLDSCAHLHTCLISGGMLLRWQHLVQGAG